MKNNFLIITFLFLLLSCGEKDSNNNSTEWLIPQDEVFDGGPGKDGIPSVDNPNFSAIAEIDFLEPQDLVVAIKAGNEIKAYPHPILDWHEIVNDKINDMPLALTYCPLTGTAIAWKRTIDGKETTFGVSGLLYNSNLIPYDRETDSNWSQALLTGINGENIESRIETYPVLEMTWETFQKMFENEANVSVMNLETGFNRDYDRYPYGTFKTNHDQMFFPVNPDDARLPRKQRGLGILINEVAKFYPLNTFENTVDIKEDNLNGENIVVVGSDSLNFIAAYNRILNDGTNLTFETIEDDSAVMKDNEGNEWNLFGEAISGPREGEHLETIEGFVGYWFAWGTFYPELDIWEE